MFKKRWEEIIKEGDLAPDFELLDQNGEKHTLKKYKGKKLVIYFYPKDDTPGCTAEACSIRDNYSVFKKEGIVVLGISADKQISHKKFSEKYSLPFPILSDPSHEVLSKYGVWMRKNLFGQVMMGIARVTYIINEEGRIVKIFNKVTPSEHAAEIFEVLNVKNGKNGKDAKVAELKSTGDRINKTQTKKTKVTKAKK
jgi:peroxiredoxin Q/BCP